MGLGPMERKTPASFERVLEPADALCRLERGGHGGCEATQRLQTSLLVLEGCVLFPVGLNESSLCCFRLLMRVPSGLLRVSWPSPRKEMMQLWLLVSQADPLFRRHKERTFRPRLPVVLKNSDCTNQLRASRG